MQLLSTKKNKLLLLLPTCLVYVVYIILPILVSLYYSFTKYSGISKPRLYGLKNYIRLLDDPYFWIALKNTAIILGISILLLGIGAFFVAMLQPMRGVNVCKALIFAPAIIASIIAGVIWGYLLDPVTGLVNNTHFLRETGAEDVLRGDALVREVGKLTGLPVICTAVEERLLPALRDADLAGELFPMTPRMRPDWLDR